MSLSLDLKNRGFIHQFSAESLAEILDGEKRTIYLGVDPSADSIHAGNFALFMLLRHLKDAGHRVILLIGGGTGMIGDPKPDVERPLTPPEEVAARVVKLSEQAKRLLGTEAITFVNNHDWLGSLKLIDFLRDIGKHFTVNELLKKDAIATRLQGESGISYTEFAYPLLQGYDFLQLHHDYGCDVQIGGSDQWGNIIAGVDLVRKKKQQTVYGITIPLIIDKTTGKKFGKSEGNAVWLDAERTSPYAFYQFWLNVSDENVTDYLKIFTFLPLADIEILEAERAASAGERQAQKTLAKEVTRLVHGEEIADACVMISNFLFGESNQSFNELSEEHKSLFKKFAPSTMFKEGTLLVDVLVDVEVGLASSKREAREFIANGAVAQDQNVITDISATLKLVGDNNFVILRRGKKRKVIVEIIPS